MSNCEPQREIQLTAETAVAESLCDRMAGILARLEGLESHLMGATRPKTQDGAESDESPDGMLPLLGYHHDRIAGMIESARDYISALEHRLGAES